MTVRPYLVNGEWRTGEDTFEVTSPFDDSVVAEVGVPTAADVEEAIGHRRRDVRGVAGTCPLTARSEALDHISKRLAETVDENAELIAREGGKPLKWAKVEATRAISTFRWASEAIRHGDDELMRLDTEQALGSRVGVLRRFPIGPGPGHHAVQLPAEPGRAQGRAGARASARPSWSSRAARRRSGRSAWRSSSTRPTCPRACSRCCR